ncbi:MAG: citrate synthase [Spirochaetes bacterium]|nr:citrate synthase [Spirochaetota bacterium]
MLENLEPAKLELEGKTYLLPTVRGSEGEKAIDINTLRKDTSYVTLDNGFQNTGSCVSDITFIDGDKGILRYRGIPIEQLVKKSNFSETAYLIVYGKLPDNDEYHKFADTLNSQSMIHEDMLHFFHGLPNGAHPMATLSSMVNSLSVFYPEVYDPERENEAFDVAVARVIAKIRTIAAFSYKKSIGEPFVYPKHRYKYCANFLHMMFASPVNDYKLDHVLIKALNQLLILHADHEQNCSTSTVRLVGSSQVNLYASICAGICALWGPLHGGANQKVIEMLGYIKDQGISVQDYLQMVKDKKNSIRLMGFGHRVYKNYDPRAKIIKKTCREVLDHLNIKDPLLDLAMEMEEAALNDDYFIERKLYPNVDFYSGIIYKAMGIPLDMFTVMFAIGRLPGWIAQWKEMRDFKPAKIGRPRQIYTGPNLTDFTPMQERK